MKLALKGFAASVVFYSLNTFAYCPVTPAVQDLNCKQAQAITLEHKCYWSRPVKNEAPLPIYWIKPYNEVHCTGRQKSPVAVWEHVKDVNVCVLGYKCP